MDWIRVTRGKYLWSAVVNTNGPFAFIKSKELLYQLSDC
jgi:hypothetical protein